MADTLKGKMIWQGEGKTRRRAFVLPTKKGGTFTPQIQPDKISADLLGLSDDEIEIEAEMEYGQPLRVWAAGKSWSKPQTTQNLAGSSKSGGHHKKGGQSKGQKKPGTQGQGTQQGQDPSLPNSFHNPYNFVPAPEREPLKKLLDDKKLSDDQKKLVEQLCDATPCGHDRYHPDRYTGKITVKMTVKTPLLLPDTAGVEIQGDDHKLFPVKVIDGKPFIHPTAVKGMLRSAFEAVTNSRMGVFNGHSERLAFRMNTTGALQLVPAVIEKDKVVLCTGSIDTSSMYANGSPPSGHPQYAAWIGKYGFPHDSFNSGNKAGGKAIFKKKNYSNLCENGKKVWAFVTLWERTGQRGFKFWNVVELEDASKPKPTNVIDDKRKGWKQTNLCKDNAGNQIGMWVEGIVCVTNHNIGNKHDERLFFFEPPTPSNQIEITIGERRDEWKRLIQDYHDQHIGEKPPSGISWSSFITNPSGYRDLKDGTLCYAKVSRNGSSWELEELYPVMISRRLHKLAPNKLLPGELKPATSIDELSPADRVFGWVRQEGKDKVAAYRGQLRIGPITLAEGNPTGDGIDDFNGQSLPLQILGQPKPQQGRFYVAEDKSGKAQPPKRDNESAGYDLDTKGLRGRKVYPHHAGLPSDYWEKPTESNLNTRKPGFFKEYRRPDKNGAPQTDNQNRSIKGWVKPETQFTFDIHVTNLSSVELGALIWLLNLPPDHYHRFGGGKPLGFGSVALNLEASEILTGSEMKEFYQQLDGHVSSNDPCNDAVAKFESACKLAGYGTLLESFKRSSSGHGTGLPTHYPRARRYKKEWNNGQPDIKWLNDESGPVPPHVEGLAYEWFVENNRLKDEQRPLPFILDDKGHPIYPHEVKKE